ncbi:MAG: hypothetical protein IH616_12275 [Gemmatimonadales bacterium]|nr:hypothetical protein [Gemmatimonadales bacterium]
MPATREDCRTPSITGLEYRVLRLERANRWLGAGLALSLVVCLGAFLPPRAQSPDILRARRLQVIDDQGRVRIDLRHDSTETGLFVLDGVGEPRVGAAQFAHGGGGFALHGPGLKGAAVLYLKGTGSLTFFDSAGTVTSRFPPSTER